MAKKLDFKDFLTVDYAPGMDPIIKRNAKKRKGEDTETSGPAESTEVNNPIQEALNASQRRMRAIQMRRAAPKIAMGRERAARRMADPKRLKNRANRAARNLIFKKLTKGVSKDEMTFQRRQDIEKRLDTPQMKKVIERLATKLLQKERKMEIARHQSQQSQGDK